ncbi:glycosyltransferase family 2 protein [Mesorhizobium sp. BH1-1-5]|uniref:glycosyltransferase family 2 protein n=1 Tax=unclassified Mesorhizobium TaxID=325217 RepID=UPI00112763EC|nr:MULTISPECIES: glycosyltransferase family 2 protein [unclassified Mesorhizobium]MBZ9986358.1 glycosyltransferase family 2 protein [Mesorhizobium sp. BH1-1-5]TPJ74938.1 glycosyltransferase family 2 protein [Mesorhizobium sp. B2-7-1]
MTREHAISLIVHTRDSEATLPRLLDGTRWAAERIVVDMQSRDKTVEIANAAGCRVMFTAVVDAVDPIRNQYLAEASHEWILVLDSDEYLAADAHEALQQLIREHGANADAFAIPRFNSIAGHVMRGSGFYPDHQVRLFRRGTVAWQPGHHRLPKVLTGRQRLRQLEPPHCVHIHHENYPDIASFIAKQVRYALTDDYDPDPEKFDFGIYLAEAHAEFARRHEPSQDGELSTAVATVLAWDRIMRGLIHWERLGRRQSLNAAFSLPISIAAAPGKRSRPGTPLRNVPREIGRWIRREMLGRRN